MNQFLLSGLISSLAIIISVASLRETIILRKASFKPLLMPARITYFSNDDNLFACNIEYPVADIEEGEPKIFYFGIQNIGKGPANNVMALKFISEGEPAEVFRLGSNIIRIPEGIMIPFTIRIALTNDTDLYFKTYTSTIYYEDLFSNRYYLSVRLWINNGSVAVIEYSDKKNPQWKDFNSVVWREVESNGFFETRELEKKLSSKKNT